MIRGTHIGRMDVFLTIQEPTRSRDATTSEEVLSWSNWKTTWAEKVSVQRTNGPFSKEIVEGEQIVAKKQSHFRIRYIDGLTEDMRVLRSGVAEYILGIEEQDRRKFLILTTESRDNG